MESAYCLASTDTQPLTRLLYLAGTTRRVKVSRFGFDGAFDLLHSIDQYATLQEIQRGRVYHGAFFILTNHARVDSAHTTIASRVDCR